MFILNCILELIFSIIICFFISFLCKKYSIFYDKSIGVQKIHSTNAIRIGGLSIWTNSFIIIFFILPIYNVVVMFCLIPALVIGLLEDFKHNISIKLRLLLTFVTALLLILFTDSRLVNIDIEWFNSIIEITFFGILISAVGITVTANAWNFIDGLNGLASGLGIQALVAISVLAHFDKNHELFLILLIISISILGFFILNIFTGKIFLGDSGAYIIGSVVAWGGLELTKNSSVISPWAVFLIIIYPATEITFSVFRRILMKKNPSLPDSNHLHSLLYKILLKKWFKNKKTILNNTLCGILILIFSSFPIIYAVYAKGVFKYVFDAVFVFILSYLILYTIIFIYSNKTLKETSK